MNAEQLTTIEMRHQGAVESCKVEMLDCWLHSTSNPTWEGVVKALYLMEKYNEVAETIEIKYMKTLTLKRLTYELKPVTNWYLLGINLNLNDDTLRTIQKDHRGDNDQCKIEMLVYWLKSTINPTWKDVADALHLMDEHKVAKVIQKRYISFGTTTTGGTSLIPKPPPFLFFDLHSV